MVKSPLQKFLDAKSEIENLIDKGFLDDLTGVKALNQLVDKTSAKWDEIKSKAVSDFSAAGTGTAQQTKFATGFRANNPVTTAANRLAVTLAKNSGIQVDLLGDIATNTAHGSAATVAYG